jgi:predicted thioesterase
MPGVLIVEAMAQAGGVLLLSEFEDRHEKLVVFTGIERARFRRPVVPGDTLRIEVNVKVWRGDGGRMEGIAYVEGKKVAEATISCRLVASTHARRRADRAEIKRACSDRCPHLSWAQLNYAAPMHLGDYPAWACGPKGDPRASVPTQTQMTVHPTAIPRPHRQGPRILQNRPLLHHRPKRRTRRRLRANLACRHRRAHENRRSQPLLPILVHRTRPARPQLQERAYAPRDLATTTIREFVTINRGTAKGGGLTRIGSHTLIMAYSHVAR